VPEGNPVGDARHPMIFLSREKPNLERKIVDGMQRKRHSHRIVRMGHSSPTTSRRIYSNRTSRVLCGVKRVRETIDHVLPPGFLPKKKGSPDLLLKRVSKPGSGTPVDELPGF
jgi:hypothetical protein